MADFSYIQSNYHVPAAMGGWVVYTGNGKDQIGQITGIAGAHLMIRLDGENDSAPYHPTWKLEYLNNDDRRLLGEIAVSLAVATLKAGDRIRVSRCGFKQITVTYKDEWWGCWIVTATLDDIHPLSIIKVNGVPRSIRAEANRFLSSLPASAREALRADCAARKAKLDEEVHASLASATDSDDEIPF